MLHKKEVQMLTFCENDRFGKIVKMAKNIAICPGALISHLGIMENHTKQQKYKKQDSKNIT